MDQSASAQSRASKKPPILMLVAILVVVPGALYVSWIIYEQFTNNIFFQSQLQPVLLPFIVLVAVIIGSVGTVLARKKRAHPKTGISSSP